MGLWLSSFFVEKEGSAFSETPEQNLYEAVEKLKEYKHYTNYKGERRLLTLENAYEDLCEHTKDGRSIPLNADGSD